MRVAAAKTLLSGVIICEGACRREEKRSRSRRRRKRRRRKRKKNYDDDNDNDDGRKSVCSRTRKRLTIEKNRRIDAGGKKERRKRR